MAKPVSAAGPITVTHGPTTTSFATSAAAFSAAQDGDTITFGKGTYEIGAQAVSDNHLTVQGVSGTVLNGGLQVDAAVTDLHVQNLSITNGAMNSDWANTPIGIYSFGSTHLVVDNVRFEDTSGPVNMVGISARTAGPGAGSEFDVSNSTFYNLANGVDVENGVSADISSSLFHNAAVVTNNNDITDHLTVTKSQFEAHSGFVFVEGNQWSDLVLQDNRGNDGYYIYAGPDFLTPHKIPGYDVNLHLAHVGSDGFFV